MKIKDDKEYIEVKKKIKKAHEALRPLLRKRDEIENKYDKLKAEKKVGKYFAYRDNNYGGEEKWDVFYKILGVTGEFGDLLVLKFEKEPDKITIETESISNGLFSPLVSITKSEFQNEFSKMIKSFPELKNLVLEENERSKKNT